MKLRIRRVLSLLLVLAMMVGFLPQLDLGVKTSAATPANEPTTAVYVYVTDISKYRGTTEAHDANNNNEYDIEAVYTDYPAKEGYVFAGWYQDAADTNPVSADTKSGGAYAKFVPEGLMRAKAQVSTTTDYTTASSSLRFVAAVESLNYQQVGFLLNKEGSSKTYTHGAVTVYTALSAAVEGGSLTATSFNSTGTHMFTLTVTGIKDQASNYRATPFWITHDGTKVDHVQTADKAVEMGVAANVAAGKTQVTEDLAWYKNSADVLYIGTAAEFKAFAELSKTNNFAGKTIVLTDDIAFNAGIAGDKLILTSSGNPYGEGAEATVPVGSNDVPFAGTFDGQGHTISGLASKTGYDALFAIIEGATIKNVNIARSTMRGGSGGGVSAGLVAVAKGANTIENIYVESDVNIYAATNQGGIVGVNKGQLVIRNSWSKARVNPQWGGNVYAGGLVALNSNDATTTLLLENCLYSGELVGTAVGSSFIGGLVGAFNNNSTTTVKNCLVAGTISATCRVSSSDATASGYIGSITGSKSWTAARTVVSNTYVTEESYKQNIRPDQNFGTAVVRVAAANIQGEAAIANVANLFANGWVAQKSGVPVPAVFADANSVDASWYNTTDTVFEITTAAQLNGLVYLAKSNTFSGKTVKLGADITYNTGNAADWATTAPAYSWSPIGNTNDGWKGTFDGQNHTISGLYCSNTGYAAFIARMYAGGALKNVKIVNSYFASTGTGDSFHNGAGILGRVTGAPTISGIYTDASFKGVKGVGIVAFSDSGSVTMTNCWFNGTIDVTGATNVGGMVSSVANNVTHTFTGCLFTGTMTGTTGGSSYVGGIYGIGPYGATIKMTNCLVAGNMTAVTGSGKVGSIAGNNPGGNKSVHSDVKVTAATHANVAGAGGTLSNFKYTLIDAPTAADTSMLAYGIVDAWGIYDISWYDANATEYVLYDAADLYGFSYLQETNSFKGKTVKLGADIVLNEGDAKTWATTAPANVWNPIGKPDASLSFDGTFDGNGHTISGLYYTSASYGGALFTYTGASAVIKDLKLTNSYIASTHGAEWSATGSVAAFVNGTTFQNVYSDAIIVTNSGYTGGIGGRVQGAAIEMENCEFAGSLTATGSTANYIGGLFGGFNTNVANASSIKNSVVSGTISSANGLVGGVAGRASGDAAKSGSINVDGFKLTGSITTANTLAGGVFGQADTVPVTVSNSKITGTVTATSGIAGGVAGRVNSGSLTVENTTSSATINGGTKLGGFVGQVNVAAATATIQNSTFNGKVTATNTSESIVAGFVAHVNNGVVVVKDSVAQGTLVAPGPYAGGVIAQVVNVAGANVTVERVVSTTDVQCASSNASGLIARIMGTNAKVTMNNNLAKATFSTDSWCTSQIIAHAQSNAVSMVNNFFVQTTNAAAAGVESNGGNITHTPVKVSEDVWNWLKNMYADGIYPDYNGFKDSGYQIADANDLYGFNLYNELNSGMSGTTVKLTADITVNEGSAEDWSINAPTYEWKPIGAIAGSASFKGTFNGQGHTISGIYCAFPSGNSLGLFREVAGTVTNFKLVNSYFANTVDSTWGYNGGIASYLNNGTISKVYTDAIVETTGAYAGGIVGFTGGTTATISECVFDGTLNARCHIDRPCDEANGTIRAHARYVGGIVGNLDATNTYVKDCIVSAMIINTDNGAHRTGGIAGGAYTNGKLVTITDCFSMAEFRADANSYHFNMVMDARNNSGKTQPVNVDTLFTDNYIMTTTLCTLGGKTLNNGGNVTGGAELTATTVRYTAEELATKVGCNAMATGALDFTNVWNYNKAAMPTLKWMGGTTETYALNTHYITTDDGSKLLAVSLPSGTYDWFVDMDVVETEDAKLGTYTDDNGNTQPYLRLTQVNKEAQQFLDIFYGYGTYLTKYTDTTLDAAQSLVADMKAFGFTEYVSSNINEDCYYTALTFGDYVYAVTYFVNTQELYISASEEQKLSPYMNETYFETAVNTEKGEPYTEYSDVTITSVALDGGGDCFVIRLKNGHYIVVDGGTSRQTDREKVAAAMGATTASDKTGKPQVVVDAWFFTHAHSDHAGVWRGGVYGALNVDVYIKGFYYNFTEKWHEDATITVGDESFDGYTNAAYYYVDQDSKGVNYYRKGIGDTSEFFVEWTAAKRTAANGNTPAWGSKNIPIYRVQAGQKFYFDGMTVEVPYTQEQVQPSEINLDLNGTGSWFLFTDDYGHTFLDAGDAERFNAEHVAELYSTDYELFGADVGKTFHHGLNPLVKYVGDYSESEPSEAVAADYDYTLVDQFYGVNTAYGDGVQTKFVFVTKTSGSWLQIAGYNNNSGSQRDLSIHEMYYLFGYILTSKYGTKVRDFQKLDGYQTIGTKIPFAAYGGNFESGSYTDTFEGTTTVTMNASGITWDHSHTRAIYK